MAKYKLSSDDAGQLNYGKGVPADAPTEEGPRKEWMSDNGFAQEGDSVDVLPLPDGRKLVLTGVNPDGVVTGVVFDADDEDDSDESDDVDEVPVTDSGTAVQDQDTPASDVHVSEQSTAATGDPA